MKTKTFFYEVFVRLLQHGKEVGRTCVQLKAISPFTAVVEADKLIEARYGNSIIARTLRVSRITEDEYMFTQVA